MQLVVQGLDNRSIGEQLGISPRTVEVHKSRLMTKLGARNLADLIRQAGASLSS
jgi:two-component system response regulator FixJ